MDSPQELDNLQKPIQAPGHFDPTDELSKEEIDECVKRSDKFIQETNDKELNLAKSDDYKLPGQEWILLSFVGETLNQKTSELGMKVWGAFPTIKEAKEQADRISKDVDHKDFDVYILEMYTWAMIPPNKDYIDDQNYHEEKLHEIITERKRQQNLAKEIFEKRKEKLMSNPDKNEFMKNKAEIMELMDKSNDDVKMGSDVHKKIFGEPKPLPKVEVVDDEGNTVSVSQGLTETDEEYKARKERLLREYIEKKNAEEGEIAESNHNLKFYNQDNQD